MSGGENIKSVVDATRKFVEIWQDTDPVDMGHLPHIVVPTPYKSFDDMSFGEMQGNWLAIRDALASADEMYAVGFSFRDQHFNQLIREACTPGARVDPLRLLLVNLREELVAECKEYFRGTSVEVQSGQPMGLVDWADSIGFRT